MISHGITKRGKVHMGPCVFQLSIRPGQLHTSNSGFWVHIDGAAVGMGNCEGYKFTSGNAVYINAFRDFCIYHDT